MLGEPAGAPAAAPVASAGPQAKVATPPPTGAAAAAAGVATANEVDKAVSAWMTTHNIASTNLAVTYKGQVVEPQGRQDLATGRHHPAVPGRAEVAVLITCFEQEIKIHDNRPPGSSVTNRHPLAEKCRPEFGCSK